MSVKEVMNSEEERETFYGVDGVHRIAARESRRARYLRTARAS